MIIVKMNESALECNIAASELREMGLSPEALMRGDDISNSLMLQINKELGEQLDYNPEREVMLMSKNMLSDGSVRIFAIKMTDEDIDRTADRVRRAALEMVTLVDQNKIEAIKAMPAGMKGDALSGLFMRVTEQVNRIYISGNENAPVNPVASVKNITKYDLYTVRFLSMDDAIRFAKVVEAFPVKNASFYKMDGEYYLIARVKNSDERVIFEYRKAAIEYGEELIFDSPLEARVTEVGERIIARNAVKRLAALS